MSIIRSSLIVFFLSQTLLVKDQFSLILSLIPPILWILMWVRKSWSLPPLLIVSIACWGMILWNVGAQGRTLVTTIPPVGAGSDELMFLRTFHLFQGGSDYYAAYFQATIDGMTARHLTTDVFTWRLPTLTYLWSLFFDSGIHIQRAFIFLCLLLLPTSIILLKDSLRPPFAFLGGLILMPYVADSLAYRTAFLFHEWWGLLFFLFGLAMVRLKKYALAIILLSLSVLIRELFILPLGFLLLFTLFGKKRTHPWIFLLPMIIFGLAFLFHTRSIQSFPLALEAPSTNRLHVFDFTLFQRMIAFSMRQYLLTPFFVNRIFLFLSFLAISVMFLRGSKQAGVVLLSFLLTGLTLAFIGNINNDYWGIVFFPILIFGSILTIQPTIKNNDNRLIEFPRRRTGVS
ncbi:MAG: hypothetical protein Q8R11_04010 [bacterium]|nr:hypothetical protein [bacterium]